ncbi:MAG TPA: efflux RND transporter permease subunit, partial [Leptospiraceae bacterium]|nr:efflux RND transporter permease subunit [Leptospiraceae bacterium]
MNRFLGFFPQRPVLCLMLTLCGCFLGAISLLHLPVGLMPNLANPGITIVTRYPGVSAEKIHQMITIPIERSVSDLGNIEEILSVSSEGESKINLLFSNEADIKIKMVEASERIDLASARFPRDVNAPYIVQYDPSDRPVFVVSFSSSHMDLKALREHIDRKVKLKFERVEGVSEVFVGGGFEREIQIAVDPGKLSTSGTTISGVQSSIAEANTYVPGGRIGIPRETSLYTDARLTSTTSLAEVPVRGQKGSWLPLDRLAHVTDSFRDPDSVARTNGEERVTIFIQKSGKANTLSLTEACETIVSGLGGEEFETHIVHNQGEHIRRAIRRVSLECIIGGIAALIVLQAFLQKRSISLLIGAAIPACILTTFFLMFLLGIDLNVMTLAGLALGAGMLVDNSVVVCESVERLAAAGADPIDAILRGAARVMPEIISSTLCTIVVFLPLLFTEPDTRRMYSGLALTVSASLVLSLVFALTVMPGFLYATSASWTRPDEGSPNRLARVMRNSLGQAKQMYTLLLLRVFRRPKPLIVAAILLALGTPLFYQLSKKEYLDAVDSGQIEATADLKSGTHLERTVQIIQQAEAAIRRHPLVKEVSTKIEKSHATLHIRLRDGAGKSNQDIIEELRALTDHNEDAFIYYNT